MVPCFRVQPGLALLLAVLAVAGCGQPEKAARVNLDEVPEGLTEFGLDAEPAEGGWLIQRLPAEMPHLNPLTSSDAYATEVMEWVFDGLLDRDPETLEMEPRVAERWEISEDHLTYTFYLRKGVTFSDGEPLTAHDVKFTYDKMMDPKTDSPHLRNYYKDVTSCEVVDDYTVRYTCSKPYYRHIVMLGMLEILPEHVYGQGDFNNHPNNRKPIGSGMYTLEEWETGIQLVLERNPGYWGKELLGAPHFDRIVYQFIVDSNAAFVKLSRGDLDVMALRAEDWVRRANTPKFNQQFNKFSYYRPAYSYLGWNRRNPLFADKNVRRAMTMLLDRERILDEVYYGLAKIMTGSFMPGTAIHNENIAPWPFDPDRAKQLLTEAGWTDTDSDGLLDKDGRKFAFEVLTTNQNPSAEKILTLYKEELARVGIQLGIRQMEWASMVERVDARNFDCIIMGWQMPPDPDPYQVWHSSQTEAGSNYVGFNNAEADQIIEEARVSFEAEKREKLYRRFHEILHEVQPYTFLFTPKALVAVDKRVHGIQVYPYGPEPQEWFVPAGMQRYGK